MGHKVNPIGFRLGFNKNWTSHWFGGRSFATFLREDYAIKQVIEKRFHHAGISNVEIFRNREDVVVTIYSSRPGIIIGRSGAGAQELRTTIEKAIRTERKTLEKVSVRVNIMETRTPELNATVVAEGIASQIERRISVKRAMRQAMERSMERRAKGIKINVSGRLNGAEIARSEHVSSGSIPLQTLRSDISYAQAIAITTYGVVGVKVWIYLGEQDTLPQESTPDHHHRTPSKQR